MKRITTAITGSGGFLGQALKVSLEGLGHRALPVPSWPGQEHLRSQRIGDDLLDVLQNHQVDTVIHLAGAGRGDLPFEVHRWSNLGSSEAVTRAVIRAGFRGVLVFSSSAAVYGDTGSDRATETMDPRPCSALGETKLQAELCLQERLADLCEVRIARIFNLFGPGQRKLAVYELTRRILDGESPLTVFGSGGEIRDFVPLEVVLQVLTRLATSSDAPGLVNVCSGVPTTILELVRTLLQLAGRDRSELRFRPDRGSPTASVCVGDPQRLTELIGERPGSSEERLRQTVEWIRDDSLLKSPATL